MKDPLNGNFKTPAAGFRQCRACSERKWIEKGYNCEACKPKVKASARHLFMQK